MDSHRDDDADAEYEVEETNDGWGGEQMQDSAF